MLSFLEYKTFEKNVKVTGNKEMFQFLVKKIVQMSETSQSIYSLGVM